MFRLWLEAQLLPLDSIRVSHSFTQHHKAELDILASICSREHKDKGAPLTSIVQFKLTTGFPQVVQAVFKSLPVGEHGFQLEQ